MRHRISAALLAGTGAIIVNMLALRLADAIPLATAHGGLLRLIRPWVGPVLDRLGLGALWAQLGGPAPGTPLFQSGFHFMVGLAMAVFYALALEPLLPGKAWIRGLLYAALVWILNAAVVLPATGEGFAGSAHLTIAGMIWFAAAHTLFFLLLAIAYARLRWNRDRPTVKTIAR